MSDLLPCPRCGGTNLLHYEGNRHMAEAVCCPCGVDFTGTPAQWNDRAAHPEITALRAENERLRAALEEIAAAKPQQIGDTGFQQGPLSLWMWAKRTARAALDGQPAPGKEEA